MIELKSVIGRCLRMCKPPVTLYTKDENGEFHTVPDGAVADIMDATEELEHEIDHEVSNYLMAKEAEVNSRLIQTKCDAYELALTHSRPIERIK